MRYKINGLFLFLLPFRIHADRLFIGKTSIDRLLTHDTYQIINGNVTIHGNILLDSEMDINHLTTNGRIFGVDVPALIEDSYILTEQNETINVTTFKRFENITIDRLIIDDGCDFWQNGKTTAEIEQLLYDLQTDFKLTGPIAFDSEFIVNNITVVGTINDIPTERFGKEWLRTDGSHVIMNCKFT